MSPTTAILSANSTKADVPSADVSALQNEERDALIVSARPVDGSYIVVSRYGDDIWWLASTTTNTAKSGTKLDFSSIPASFKDTTKAMMYRLIVRGREGKSLPGSALPRRLLDNIRYFLEYVASLGITKLCEITPLTCFSYMQNCRNSRRTAGVQNTPKSDQPLAPSSLEKRLAAVEMLFEMSQYTGDVMPRHPWPDSSAGHLSGRNRLTRCGGSKTPLIPDSIFTAVFCAAWSIVQNADHLLDLRDKTDIVATKSADVSNMMVKVRQNAALKANGWDSGYRTLLARLLDIRTACYIVIASLSGCRNHELAFLRKGAVRSSKDDDGARYWWMQSRSTKTGEGETEWMIPEAAVSALAIMDRWCEPYQKRLQAEIASYRATDPADIRIAEALDHVDAIFVGIDKKHYNQVRTISVQQWNLRLKDFARSCGLQWELSSHQFRRKFANYAARSVFGDLRYLRDHFKHWSLDMTLSYALNESQEVGLYQEIQYELDEIKGHVVASWCDKVNPLAGGYGKALVSWRGQSENVRLFKSRDEMIRTIAQSTSIRSNGHAWCTADDNKCIGNDIERTRCGDCKNSVIAERHASIYQGLYVALKELEDCEDIGDGGKARVARDLDRCRDVLACLGHDPLMASL